MLSCSGPQDETVGLFQPASCGPSWSSNGNSGKPLASGTTVRQCLHPGVLVLGNKGSYQDWRRKEEGAPEEDGVEVEATTQGTLVVVVISRVGDAVDVPADPVKIGVSVIVVCLCREVNSSVQRSVLALPSGCSTRFGFHFYLDVTRS